MPSKSLKYWVLTLFVLNIIYLVVEFAFNAHLVDTASNIGLTQDQVNSVEHIGRIVSGIGFALLMSGLIPLKMRESHGNVFALWLCFIVCVPVMYFGQRAVIDYVVENKFTAEDRQLAQYSILLKSGIAKNTIKFKGIDFDPKLNDSPEQKTFLSLIGAVVFQSNSLISNIKKQQNTIAQRYVHNVVVDKEGEYWDEYSKARLDFNNRWESYKKHSREYVKEHNKIDKRIDGLWRDVESNIKSKWGEYKEGVESYKNRSYQKSDQVRHNLDKYFKGRSKCRNKSCQNRYDKKYESQIKNSFGKHIEPKFWLTKKSLSWSERNCKKTKSGRNCKTSIVELINVFGWFEDKDKKIWDKSRVAVGERLIVLNEDKFKSNSGGYPYNIKSLPSFKYYSVTVNKLRKNLKQKGIKLGENWKVKKDAAFIRAAERKIRKDIDSQWYKTSIKLFGMKITPNLKYESFIRTKLVENKLRKSLGENYIRNMRPDYNQEDFFQKILKPLIKRNARKILKELHAETKEFENGRKYAEKGKQYLRSLIVPPISLGLSLFFALIALIKLPLAAIKLVHLFKNITSSITSNSKLQASILLVTSLIIIFLPFAVIDNKFSSDKSGFRILLNDATSNNFLIGNYIEWIIRTQPIVYPIGRSLPVFSKL